MKTERRILITGSSTRCSVFIFLFVVLIRSTKSLPLENGNCQGIDCCTECPSGFGVAQVCNQSDTFTDTVCQACQVGISFSDSASRSLPCRMCSSCPANSRVKRSCNVTHDTECECERDYYQEITIVTAAEITAANSEVPTVVDNSTTTNPADTLSGHPWHSRHKHRTHNQQQQQHASSSGADSLVLMSCKVCDLCPHGWGAARPCSPHQNTVCRKCPAGTFSSVLSSSLACVVCSVCREDQVTLHECTPIQDTVCADKDMGHPSRRVITKPVDNLTHPADDYNNEGIISVYCAILGAIVLGLLIYVVMKQWRLRSAANKLAHFDSRNGGPATVPLTGSSSLGTADCKMNSHRKFDCEISPCGSRRMQESDGSRGSRGSDSAFVAPGSDGYSRDLKPITLDSRLRDICTAKRREMEVMLNAKKEQRDWKALARELGYTSSRIASFEQYSTEKQTGPTRHLFADWAKREDSTVQNLLQALCNIGRHDVTLVLLPIQQRAATTLPRTRYQPISVV